MRSHPGTAGKAIAFYQHKQNKQMLTAVNAVAVEKGIHGYMLVADAKAVHPDIVLVHETDDMFVDLLLNIARFCIRFSPDAALEDDDGVVINCSGCTHLWGGDEAYASAIQNRFTSMGYHVQLAIADTPGAAWAISRYGGAYNIVPKGETEDTLKPFPVAALQLMPETIEWLEKLGISTIGRLMQLPAKAMKRRLGGPAIEQLYKALGILPQPWKCINEPATYNARLECLSPVVNAIGLATAIENVLGNVLELVKKEGLGVRNLLLDMYRSDGSRQQVTVAVSKATINEKHLFKLFELKMPRIKPAPGIELFVLHAAHTELLENKSVPIFATANKADSEAISLLTDRVMNKLGKNAMYRLLPSEHYLPEKNMQQVYDAFVESKIPFASQNPRPALLLSTPEPITVSAPIPDYPPIHFNHKGVLHKIVKADGPERIAQEWWVKDGRHRDYFFVEDEIGNRYWLFRSGHYYEKPQQKWFLHGYFP